MNKQLFKTLLLNQFTRNISIKRKLPLDKDYAKELPVSEYIISAHNRNRVYVWGNAKTGALGIPHPKKRENLERIEYLQCPKRLHFGETNEVTTIACGFGFTVFGTNGDNKMYGTGLNTDSQIGCHEIRKNNPLGVIFLPQPIFLPFKYPEKTTITKLAAGRAHLAALTDEGLFLLGNNSYGQCGRTIVVDENYVGNAFVNNIKDLNGVKIVDVECGQDHTLVLLENGSVYSCGWGADGQTGLGHFNCEHNFTKVNGDIEHEKIVKLACSSDFVLALNDCGDVFGWGNTEYNQMTMPDNSQQVCIPTNIKFTLGKIKDVAAGGSFCLVLTETGTVHVWGFGLLGTGPDVQHSQKPLQIPQQLFGRNDFNPNCQVKSIACGLSHMAAVTNTGELYTWGRNRNSCLGLGHTKDQYFPLKVSIGAKVNQIFCGLDHTVALCKSYLMDNK